MQHDQKTSLVGRWLGVGVAAGTLVIAVGFVGAPESDYFFKINRSIDVFGRVYREIALNYVDELDPEKFMESGIEGMLGSLDPYTVYIGKQDGDEVELLTTGRYGGIGVTIGQREGALQVITVMDGYSAQRQGIQPGDRIIEVDGIDVRGKKPDHVRSLTRGDPGTETHVTIERDGEKEPLHFVLIREEIQLRNVTYADMVDGGIGYLRLERFTRRAGEEVHEAVQSLKLKGELNGLVLDVRGNPGGLLESAVDVMGKFVSRGSLIVSTKGRRTETGRKYLSAGDPLVPAVPLAVLTDRSSASASEIVSGAVQDLDRGLVVGTRTFGKGLVQTILPLDDGAQLKITTARYYTPSGRSIQEIEYHRKDGKGIFLVTPDSAKRAFTTAGGRIVFEHGGITPDSVVAEEDFGPMVRELYRKSLFFRFVNAYRGRHKSEVYQGITEDILNEFKAFLDEQKFDYQEETGGKIKEIRTHAERFHYTGEVLRDLDLIAAAVEKETRRGFERYKDHIGRELHIEFMARTSGEQGRIAASLVGDRPVAVAIALLKDRRAYNRMLGKQ